MSMIDMRTELLEEHRRNIHTDQQKTEQQQAVVSSSEEGPEEDPALDGCTDIKEIRILLRDWVSLYKQGPEPQDVEQLLTLLSSLINCSDMENARLVIIYLDYLTEDLNDWKQQVSKIKETVQKLTCSKYGYPLAFY